MSKVDIYPGVLCFVIDSNMGNNSYTSIQGAEDAIRRSMNHVFGFRSRT